MDRFFIGFGELWNVHLMIRSLRTCRPKLMPLGIGKLPKSMPTPPEPPTPAVLPFDDRIEARVVREEEQVGAGHEHAGVSRMQLRCSGSW